MAALKKQQQDLTAKLEAAERRATAVESKLAEAEGKAGSGSENKLEEVTKVWTGLVCWNYWQATYKSLIMPSTLWMRSESVRYLCVHD